MIRFTLTAVFVTLVLTSLPPAQGQQQPGWLEAYREPARRLIAAEMSDAFAWRRLALLTDTIGSRFSGTPQLDHAIRWAIEEMKRDGLENVRAERVTMVPHWVRGSESAETIEPSRQPMAHHVPAYPASPTAQRSLRSRRPPAARCSAVRPRSVIMHL